MTDHRSIVGVDPKTGSLVEAGDYTPGDLIAAINRGDVLTHGIFYLAGSEAERVYRDHPNGLL